MEQLKSSCRAIAKRHNEAHLQHLTCVLCGNVAQGSDALMVHFFQFHQITLEHLDDVKDLDAMLQFLERSVHPKETTEFHCPVCHRAFGVVADLEAHVTNDRHHQWNHQFVPQLCEYLVTEDCSQSDQDDDNEGTNATVNAAAGVGIDVEDPDVGDVDDDDEEAEESVCLYCSAVFPLTTLQSHLNQAHGFNLTAFLASKPCTDEYDLIRMANFVRECFQRRVCPVASCSHVEPFADIELWEHHVKEAGHHFPLSAPQDDKYLIPRLPGDMLIAYLLECGIDDDEESSKYPMVDTVQQLAAKHREADA